jgi:hypothetical protein
LFVVERMIDIHKDEIKFMTMRKKIYPNRVYKTSDFTVSFMKQI